MSLRALIHCHLYHGRGVQNSLLVASLLSSPIPNMLITDYMANRILSPEWDPIEFQPPREWLEIRTQPLECIRAVCLSPPDYFHPNIWAIFLSTSEVDMTAIRLECQPTDRHRTIILQGSKAKILFQKTSVLFPRDVAATFVLGVNPGFTVADIHSIIVTNDRHKYEIDEECFNIRTWVYDQINLFNQHGIFANHGEVEIVNDALQRRWPGGDPNPLEEGAYYG